MDKLNIDVSERLPLTDLLALPHLKEPLTSEPDFDGSVANSIKSCFLPAFLFLLAVLTSRRLQTRSRPLEILTFLSFFFRNLEGIEGGK